MQRLFCLYPVSVSVSGERVSGYTFLYFVHDIPHMHGKKHLNIQKTDKKVVKVVKSRILSLIWRETS